MFMRIKLRTEFSYDITTQFHVTANVKLVLGQFFPDRNYSADVSPKGKNDTNALVDWDEFHE